jgi:hypothetical protein
MPKMTYKLHPLSNTGCQIDAAFRLGPNFFSTPLDDWILGVPHLSGSYLNPSRSGYTSLFSNVQRSQFASGWWLTNHLEK